MSTDAARHLRVAVTQWRATRDVDANVRIALDLIDQAAAEGIDLILLPENGLMLGTNAEMRERAFSEDSPEIDQIRRAARAAGAVVVVGGLKNRVANGIVNSALVIDSQGGVIGRYDKAHLFDAQINGQSFEASTVESAGDSMVLLDVKGVLIGLTICYDVRFPELYRQLDIAGAQVILVPSAFTFVTGSAHWHTLLRSRAIENAAYVVASATIRSVGAGDVDAFETYGHALAVDPWGEVVVDLGEAQQAFAVVDLDLSIVDRTREKLPVLRQVRPDLYRQDPRLIEVTS